MEKVRKEIQIGTETVKKKGNKTVRYNQRVIAVQKEEEMRDSTE